MSWSTAKLPFLGLAELPRYSLLEVKSSLQTQREICYFWPDPCSKPPHYHWNGRLCHRTCFYKRRCWLQAVVVNRVTSFLSKESAPALTINGKTITANSVDLYILSGQTLPPGRSATILDMLVILTTDSQGKICLCLEARQLLRFR